MNRLLPIASSIALALAVGSPGAQAVPPDWSKVPSKKIVLFYPGIASLEWTLNGSDHSGARAMRKGETCASCHDEEAADVGNKIVSGKTAEPSPPKGKAGSIPVAMQAAHDGTNLYLRFQWKTPPSAGGKKMDEKSQVKFAVMLGTGNNVEYGTIGGCWASCHHDLRSMPDVSKDAAKHPKAKALDIHANGPTKYLKESRTALEIKNSPRGGWDKLKPDAEIDAALKTGKFLEIMQYRSGEKPRAGYVLEARRLKETAGVAEGKQEGGNWTVTFTRKLVSAGAGSHAIQAGKIYTVGFAIHDDWSNERFHHVSLGYSIALDNPKADINATKQ